jgi:hypothetical protein
MDKELIVPKWVLKNGPKIPQTPQNLSAQIVGPSPKVWDFDEKRLYLASIVCVCNMFKDIHTECSNNSNETHTFMCLGRAGRFGQC